MLDVTGIVTGIIALLVLVFLGRFIFGFFG